MLLIRDPKDVAVSQFFQWKHRMQPSKKTLNGYPPHGDDISLFEFVMKSGSGLLKVVPFLNLWASEAGHVNELLIVRYEDMRKSPEAELTRFLQSPSRKGRRVPRLLF